MKRVSVYVKVSFRRLNDILQCNKTHYPINSYNKKCYTNMTIKQPYYCYKARHKCKLCSKKYKSFNYKNKMLKLNYDYDFDYYRFFREWPMV